MEVQASYDINNSEWVVELDGCEITAEHIADLKHKLPPDAVIYGYYPDGYDGRRDRDRHVSPASMRATWNSSIGTRHRKRIIATRAIAAQSPAPAPVPELPKIKLPRQRPVGPRNQREWTEEEDAWLKRMTAEGHSSSEVAKLLNRSRNSIIGYCRRRGYQLGNTNTTRAEYRVRDVEVCSDRQADRACRPADQDHASGEPSRNGHSGSQAELRPDLGREGTSEDVGEGIRVCPA